jgi:hypothetical protein
MSTDFLNWDTDKWNTTNILINFSFEIYVSVYAA